MKNSKISCQAFFKNAQCDIFRFFHFQFFLHFWKYTQDILFFLNVYFWIFAPFRKQKRPKNDIWQKKLCGKTCCLGKTIIINMNLFRKIHWYKSRTNRVTFPQNTFLGKFHCTNFFRANCKFSPKTQKHIFFGHFYPKAEGQMISEHPGLTLRPKNLRKKWCWQT